MIGETISHYKIIEHLGSGGMGEVYKAEDLRLQRYVALKVVHEESGKSELSEQSRARFLKEARAASALNHPNIATVYEIDEVVRDGSRYSFIVMEYVQGRTLKESGSELNIEESLDIVTQVADALAEAHDRGVIHRDIKPSNIIINENNRAKILDFGVAKYNPLPADDAETASIYHTDLLKTTPGTVIGTFAYMSPEQALGKEIDGRTDIFSLGVLLYELIARRLPFTGSSSLGVVDAILHSDPLPPGMFNYKVTPELESVINKMLEKNIGRRYPGMRDLLDDLNALRQGMPVEIDPYETVVGNTTSSSKIGIIGTRTFGNRVGKSLAVVNFTNITANPADDWIGTGIAETVTADLKKIEGITVIGRERVFEVLRRLNIDKQNEGDTTMATMVGREVGARWIVIGGYQKIGEMLRITARGVDVETGEVVKTVKIDGQMKDIFDLQDKIVYELSQDFDLSLRSGERENIQRKETDVVEAYEYYVKAEMALDRSSREDIDNAIELLHKAIELDPAYAHAYAGLGYALGVKGQFLIKPDMLDESVEYYQKAIELDPLLADGYAGLGFTFVSMGRDDDAIGALRRAMSFAPQDHRIHAALGRVYMIGKGLFREGAAEYEQALKLNPDAGWAAQQLALACAYTGEYDRGIEAARVAIKSQEEYISGQTGVQIIGSFSRLAHLYILQGKYDDAVAECYRELVFLRQSNHALKERAMIETYQKLISAYVRQDNQDDARQAFDKLVKGFQTRLAEDLDDPFTRYYVACAYAMMGDKDAALDHLHKSIEGRSNFNKARSRVEIDFESLRNDEKFKALVE